MNKIAVATLAFAGGAAVGFVLGHYVVIEKEEPERTYAEDIKKDTNKVVEEPKKDIPAIDPAETESPKDDDPTQLLSAGPAHIARPGQKGVDYTKVQQIVKENNYTTPEEIQQVIDDPANEETYDEYIEREKEALSDAMAEYRKKNKDKIVPIQRDEWDTDFPEVDYEKADLYYFQGDGVLTDEDGNHLDIVEYLGTKPGQFGWYDNADERIYIRNNPKETDYQVWKQACTSEEWW